MWMRNLQLKEKIPGMGRYEKLWPVNTMVIQHRQLRRAGSSQGIRRSEKEIVRICVKFSVVRSSDIYLVVGLPASVLTDQCERKRT